jgi:hypothetical protein
VFSVVNRLLVRRLLRPALIAEQFCHVHLNSDPDEVDHGLESKPLLAFAVCYVTAHLALDLVDEKRAEAILNYCEKHLEE